MNLGYYEKIKKEVEDYRKLKQELELYTTGKIRRLLEEYYNTLIPTSPRGRGF